MASYANSQQSLPTKITTRPRRTSSLPPHKSRDSSSKPPTSSRTNSKAHAANHEVITNLIDSLSALNSPATPFFDVPGANGGISMPDSPVLSRSIRAESYDGTPDDDYFDDELAAEPPVVRTSKPPSGRSPLTAPKSKKESSSFRGPTAKSETQSHTSLQSVYNGTDRDDAVSIGRVSIEVRSRLSEQSIRSKNSAESKHSGRQKGLMYMTSRERLRSREKRSSSAGPSEPTATSLPDVLPMTLDLDAMMSTLQRPIQVNSPIQEEPQSPVSSKQTITARRGKAPKMLTLSPNTLQPPTSRSPLTPLTPRTPAGEIPARGSSLKTSGRSPRREKPKGLLEPQKPLHDEHEVSTRTTKGKSDDKDIGMDLTEDSAAIRRIRELKARKQMRDSGVSTEQGAHLGVTVQDSDNSPTSPGSDSLHSAMSSPSGRKSEAKAHRVLGLSPPSNEISDSKSGLSRTRQTNLTPSSYTRSNAEDSAPLESPFLNYSFLVKSLEIPTPTRESHSSRPRSSHAPSSTSRQASMSVAINTNSEADKTKLAPTHHRRRSSTAYDARYSVQSSSTMPSLKPENSPVIEKGSKRLSHPDLPLKAEQRTPSALLRKSRAPAVQPHVQTSKEDRPVSVDSIDAAVNSFIHAPRLSQRMRHPVNGRIISFSEVGDPKGFAVFCCVGMGLTRYVTSFYDELAKTLQLRLITPDRPGIGGSQADETVTPMTWTDDIYAICSTLKISKFALLAHSAGAVYALATALRMPQHIRGRVHLLAPWIPPSQMAPIGMHQDAPGTDRLPRSQRFLRTLPPSLLKIANASFLSPASASITRTKQSPRQSPRPKRKSISLGSPIEAAMRPSIAQRQESLAHMDREAPDTSALALIASPSVSNFAAIDKQMTIPEEDEQERREMFDERLTLAIWDKATTNANPATDLVVCLETKHTIGFRYEDITRKVVIHHGSKDSRVPAENVKWLGGIMRNCEVRILEGEGHSLMANPVVMGNLLTEIAQEWADWTKVVQSTSKGVRKNPSQNFLNPDFTIPLQS